MKNNDEWLDKLFKSQDIKTTLYRIIYEYLDEHLKSPDLVVSVGEYLSTTNALDDSIEEIIIRINFDDYIMIRLNNTTLGIYGPAHHQNGKNHWSKPNTILSIDISRPDDNYLPLILHTIVEYLIKNYEIKFI